MISPALSQRKFLKIMLLIYCQFQAPESFLETVNVTIYHFAIAIMSGKDNETGWKKQIYKIISKLDAQIPEKFKSLMQ